MLVEVVERLQRCGDRASGGDLHAQRGAQLRHHRGGFDTVAHDVADDDHQAVAEGQGIEPVPAGRSVFGGDEVLGGDIGAGNHRNGWGQQRLLHQDGRVAHVAVPLRQLLDPRLRRQPRLHAGGDVVEDQLHALNGSIPSAPGRDEEVEVPLLQAGALQVHLQAPFGTRLRFAGVIHAVEHVVDLLAFELGIDLFGRLAHGVQRRVEGAEGRVDRDEAVVWPLQADHHGRDVLEDAPHVVSRAHRVIPVLFGRHMAVPPADRCSKLVGCADASVKQQQPD